MPKKIKKTLSIGLSGLLALGIGIAQAADRVPHVLHEMVPHVVLPETIQYNKTAKNMPGNGYTGVSSPYVGTYAAYPSYQVPYTAEFKTVGQSVYPVSPQMLPLPQKESEPETTGIEEELIRQNGEARKTAVKDESVSEPIRLASAEEDVIPTLPAPKKEITQTGIFCQQPADPPSAWAFSSPIFKMASVPAGWGGGQIGSINQNGLKGCNQQVAFQPVGGGDPAASGAVPQGLPYSTFQMGRPAEQNGGPQTFVLPNGMILLTMPPDHANCGLIRCRANHTPRTMLLPPAPAGYGLPQTIPTPASQETSMLPNFGMPMMVMTPMGPMMMPQQQMPAMNPMAMNQMNQMAANPIALMNMTSAMNSSFPPIQQVQMTTAQTNPAIASQASPTAQTYTPGAAVETGDDALQTPATTGTTETAQAAQPMTLVATPFGYYAVQTSPEMAAQLAQMQVPPQQQMGTLNPYMGNPYMGLYSTPVGYVAMNPAAANPMGAFAGGQGGMSMSEMIMIMTFLNNNRPHERRVRLMDRIAERRESRKASAGSDPFAQLMQAWSTPYVSPDTTLRMPSRSAYPYGYFGVQASPISTANYGGYHNLSGGNTTYPGLY